MMTTTQATGHDQQVKRLVWLLDTMIEHLDGAPPENALGGIEQYEDEAAGLIETTGLADEAEIPEELRPVLKRTMLAWEEFGFGNTEKHPTRVSYQFTESNCMVHARLFDYLTACGLALGPERDPPPGYKNVKPPPGHWAAELVSSSGPPPLEEPDERYIRTLVVCLKGWRSRAQWRATNETPDEREVIDDPIANHKLADLCGLEPDTVSVQMRKALGVAGKAFETVGAGGNRDWTHNQLRTACPHLPNKKPLKKYLVSAGFGKPIET